MSDESIDNAYKEAQSVIWKASLKLQALGVVLELQNAELDGFTELCGFGMILSDLGDELQTLYTALNEAGLTKRVAEPLRRSSKKSSD